MSSPIFSPLALLSLMLSIIFSPNPVPPSYINRPTLLVLRSLAGFQTLRGRTGMLALHLLHVTCVVVHILFSSYVRILHTSQCAMYLTSIGGSSGLSGSRASRGQ